MILVVDDSPHDLVVLDRIFGADTIPANSIRGGLILARRHKPAVIVLDNHFPEGKRGVEHVADFRNASPFGEVIVYTCDVDAALRRECARADCQVVEKGDPDEIQTAVAVARIRSNDRRQRVAAVANSIAAGVRSAASRRRRSG
jgi:DNA-binding NarL/FixJ family response regulator